MDPALPIWALVLIASCLVGGLFIVRSRAILLAVEICLCCVSAANLYYTAGLMWVFRDGMGPSMVSSHGWEAWRRFSEDFWVPFGIIVTILVGSLACYRIRLHRIRQSAV